jgi:hypothetical protein
MHALRRIGLEGTAPTIPTFKPLSPIDKPQGREKSGPEKPTS